MTMQPALAPTKLSESRTERTRAALLAAGINLFSQQGYDATSTRQIETKAAVQRNLMTYHFGSKEQFWKACMTALNGRMADQMAPALSLPDGMDPGEKIRATIRQFVRASAAVPEVGRIIFDEGRQPSWRLEWIVAHYAGGFFGEIGRLFDQGREAGLIADIPKVSFYYMLVGSAALFAMSAEAKIITGKDAFDPATVDAHANSVAALLVPQSPSSYEPTDDREKSS
ncbi:MAG: TetR/AcrR family transcriptional regulator [Pseudomonadota bacterium]